MHGFTDSNSALSILLACAALAAGCETPVDYRFGGYVEAEKIEVGSREGGRVAEVFVEEGDEVAEGDPIVRFDTDQLQAELAQAEHRVERLSTVLDKLRAGPRPQEIAIARQELDAAVERRRNADADYKRGLETGVRVITQEKLDDLETSLQVALTDEQVKREQLNLLEEGTRAEDVTAARHELEESRSLVQVLQERLEEGLVTAPMEAIVEVFDREPGDLAPAGAPVATLVRRDQLWVRCFVPATLITFMEPGDEVRVEVDSRPNTRYTGKVLRVNRVAEYTPRNVQTFEQRADQVFGVKVRVEDPDHELRPGMAATVIIPRAASDAP